MGPGLGAGPVKGRAGDSNVAASAAMLAPISGEDDRAYRALIAESVLMGSPMGLHRVFEIAPASGRVISMVHSPTTSLGSGRPCLHHRITNLFARACRRVNSAWTTYASRAINSHKSSEIKVGPPARLLV